MLGDKRGISINNYVKDYVLFDLETTGTSTKKDEIIEISAVKVRNGEIVEEFSELVNPKIPISAIASSVNNIYDYMVKDSPTFDEVLPAFIDFIGDDILVGHNINSFDMNFIYRDLAKYYNKTITNDCIDTLRLSRKCLPELAHHRLSDLADYYGISTIGAHRALNDCRINQQVFENLGREIERRGIVLK